MRKIGNQSDKLNSATKEIQLVTKSGELLERSHGPNDLGKNAPPSSSSKAREGCGESREEKARVIIIRYADK